VGKEDLYYYDLRRTAVSLLANRGCDIITLQNINRHKMLAIAQRYVHPISDKFEKIKDNAEVLAKGYTNWSA